jgi:hypothetical protein
MRRIAVLCLLVVAGTGACGSGGTAGSTSGITGTVVAGPQCAVEQAGSPCPAEPIQAAVQVTNPEMTRVIKFARTDPDGHFRLSLEPGTYSVQALPISEVGAQFGKPVSVTVPADAFVEITLFLDTGIR